MSKFDRKLRDGIFVGYRMHCGGKWSGQYLVLGATRFQEQRPDHGHLAYDHGVNEIYVPGTAVDDKQDSLQFPVADGLWLEHGTVHSIDHRQSLRTTEEEALPTSVRPIDENPDGERPADNAGGHDDDADASTPTDELGDQAPLPSLKDTWELQGDYLVRVHRIPRTTLFAPWMDGTDDIPIAVRHIEVSRTTNPVFSGAKWPGLEVIEDAWSGQPADAKPLQNPLDGSTLTWTGETHFERVLPAPPNGKEWCAGQLVRSRSGSKRAKDIHPLQWWMMSEVARLKASEVYKLKFAEMQKAIRRRTIPRDSLDNMPGPNVDCNVCKFQMWTTSDGERYCGECNQRNVVSGWQPNNPP